MKWAIVVGEYPPQVGGVGAYSRLLARELAGDGEVRVFTSRNAAGRAADPGVTIHELPGGFGPRGLLTLDRALRALRPDVLLLQYVPHSWGFKAMNLPFCLWLFARRRREHVWVMFHEVAVDFAWRQPWRHNLIAAANYLMALLVTRSTRQVFVSIPGWIATLKPMLAPNTSVTVLPLPSNIPVESGRADTAALREGYALHGAPLLGHFGTYGKDVSDMLAGVLPLLLRSHPDLHLLLLGNQGDAFRARLLERMPCAGERIHAPGTLAEAETSRLLGLCDLMLQPYPDGISGRRTSAMAALAHGKAVATTSGELTEPFWAESGAVAMAPADDLGALSRLVLTLLDDGERRQRLGRAAKELYEARFALRHTLERLRALALAGDERGGLANCGE